MLEKLKAHLRNNAGDANVSKMTWVAIVFVIGAILLVLVTSAFRNPINRWFDKVSNDWFASENGMYEADNPLVGYQRNEHGIYEDLEYRYYYENGYYDVLNLDGIQNGLSLNVFTEPYGPDGNRYSMPESWGDCVCEISADGTTIKVGKWNTFTVYIPD